MDKSIPIAGGLAGGSADGAAALVALDRLHELGTSDHDLLAMAALLGSDVPFALVGGTALGEGHGELVTPVADEGSWWWVVVPSTGRDVDARGLPPLRRAAPRRPAACRVRPTRSSPRSASGDPRALAAALHNDLEQAACDLRPDLARADRRGRRRRRAAGARVGVGPDLRVPVRVGRPCARRSPGPCPPAVTSASYSSRTGRSPAPTLVDHG